MSTHFLWLAFTLAVWQLPTEIAPVRFNSGQSVVPYFEGWIKNPDGTFDMVFGYFNRNWKQELYIPPGANNKIEPNGPDAGQPTYFLPRRQRWMFRLRVPADFGKKEVTWTIAANGRSEMAYGNLLAAQEITDRVVMSNGNFDPGTDDPNEPPSMTVAPVQTATVGVPITLTVSVVDDGLPKPRPIRTPRPGAGPFGAQSNSVGSGAPRGLNVRWLQVGGPGKAAFEQTGPISLTGGKAVTTARFAVPGTYRLRAIASDGALAKTTEIVVTVR